MFARVIYPWDRGAGLRPGVFLESRFQRQDAKAQS